MLGRRLSLSAPLEELAERYRRYRALGVDRTISPTDDMYVPTRTRHYFHCGEDALRLIAQALLAAGLGSPRRILDMPSGSGRVTRHLVRFFPEAEVTTCDIYQHHTDFCARQFSSVPVLSKENLAEVVFPEPFDLIWCGSLLTHLPADSFLAAIDLFVRSLGDDGIALVTLHGRWSVFRQQHTSFKYTAAKKFAAAERTLPTGFGYVDDERKEQGTEDRRYGTSWSMPSYVTGLIEGIDAIRLLSYQERAWDNHQDVLILQKKLIHGRPWIFEESLS